MVGNPVAGLPAAEWGGGGGREGCSSFFFVVVQPSLSQSQVLSAEETLLTAGGRVGGGRTEGENAQTDTGALRDGHNKVACFSLKKGGEERKEMAKKHVFAFPTSCLKQHLGFDPFLGWVGGLSLI